MEAQTVAVALLLTMLVMVLRGSSGEGVHLDTMLIMVLRISSGGGGELLTMLVMCLRGWSGLGDFLVYMLGMGLSATSGIKNDSAESKESSFIITIVKRKVYLIVSMVKF